MDWDDMDESDVKPFAGVCVAVGPDYLSKI